MEIKKLNILLIKPYQKTNEIQPPLGLGYLASIIKNNHNVKIIDGIRDKLTEEQLKQEILKNRYNIIGIQCYTVDINTVKRYSNLIKKFSSDTIIVIGGPQPSMDPENTMKYLPNIDYGFIYEAEISFSKLVELIAKKNGKIKINELKKIPGFIFKNKKKIIITNYEFSKDLDNFDPSYELYKLKNYPTAPHGAFCKQYPTAPIIITRGCPFGCKYCCGSHLSGYRIRYHSINYIINKILELNKVYGIKEIHIEDDNFTMNRKFVEEFCKRLIKLNLRITWACPNGIRLDTLDIELVKLMRKSGLYSITIGIESGSDKIRKDMGKNLTNKTIYKKMGILSNLGIKPIAFFMIGYPTETKEDIEKTINFACSLNLKRANFSIFKPFPGTPIYKELVENGKLKEIKWEDFTLHKIAWTPEGITKKELETLRRKALWKFYVRPKIILNMLGEIKNIENLKFILLRINSLFIKGN